MHKYSTDLIMESEYRTAKKVPLLYAGGPIGSSNIELLVELNESHQMLITCLSSLLRLSEET